MLTFLIPRVSMGQNADVFEVDADMIDTTSNKEIQTFYEKFNLWIKSLENDSTELQFDEKLMLNNFIMFSQDGLLMKDLKFHSVESCTRQIFKELRRIEVSNREYHWMYVTLESQINRNELAIILEFLKRNKIDYRFSNEDEIVSKIVK